MAALCVSLQEANDFLRAKAATAQPIALGVFLCILSPICLFVLGVLSERPGSGKSPFFLHKTVTFRIVPDRRRVPPTWYPAPKISAPFPREWAT